MVKTKKPLFVWLICGYFLYQAVATLLHSITSVGHLTSGLIFTNIVMGILQLAAAGCLFLGMRVCRIFFLILLGFDLLGCGWLLLTFSGTTKLNFFQGLSLLFSLAVLVFATYYSFFLQSQFYYKIHREPILKFIPLFAGVVALWMILQLNSDLSFYKQQAQQIQHLNDNNRNIRALDSMYQLSSEMKIYYQIKQRWPNSIMEMRDVVGTIQGRVFSKEGVSEMVVQKNKIYLRLGVGPDDAILMLNVAKKGLSSQCEMNAPLVGLSELCRYNPDLVFMH